MPPSRRQWGLALASRLVTVVRSEGGRAWATSGLAVASDLVLTSAHPLADPSRTVITVHGAGAATPAEVVFVGAGVDVLLVRTTTATWADLTPVPWARINGERAVLCDAVGRPRAAQVGDDRGWHQAIVSYRPLSTVPGGHHELVVADGIPRTPDLWKGMSGAPVVHDDRLVALVTSTYDAVTPGMLHGLAANDILAARNADGVRLDTHLPPGLAVATPARPIGASHLAVTLEPPVRPLPRRATDLHLLHYGHAAVPYLAQPELDERLDNWLATPAYGVGLLTGRGGAGKSRAAQALCLRAVQHGWDTGWASPASRSWSGGGVGPDRPLLVVVDYPEEHPNRIGEWLREMEAAAEATPHPVKVLMLARSRSGWWVEPIRRAADMDDAAITDQGRHDGRDRLDEHYAAARVAFAATGPALLAEQVNQAGSTLEVHALALLGFSADGVLDRLLDREAEGWAAQWRAIRELASDAEDRHLIRMVVGLMTLVPCRDRAHAASVLELAGYEPKLAAAAASWFDGLYGDGPAPLTPDPVADHLIRSCFDDAPPPLQRLWDGLERMGDEGSLTRAMQTQARARGALDADLG